MTATGFVGRAAGLPPASRHLLGVASIIGGEFSVSVLAAVSGEPRAFVRVALDGLAFGEAADLYERALTAAEVESGACDRVELLLLCHALAARCEVRSGPEHRAGRAVDASEIHGFARVADTLARPHYEWYGLVWDL